MSKVLALDLGTTTGWASFNTEYPKLMVSGTWKLKPRREESSGMRYIKFINSLNQFKNQADIVVFEDVKRHLGTYAAHIYGGLLSHLQVWCVTNDVQFTGIPVGTIKKFATGKGNAGKPLMVKAACKLSGRDITSDDEADAICLLNYYIKEL